MIDSLYIGATGMQVQQTNVDTIANNLANVNTAGFKKSRVSFEDIFVRGQPGLANDGDLPAQVSVGLGSRVSNNVRSFTAGDLKQTDSPLDLAIRGNGFFEVAMPDGSVAYTRHGALQVNQEGLLATHAGYPIRQMIQVPAEALEVTIDGNGLVLARIDGESEPVELGQIELSLIQNPGALNPLGEGLYQLTDSAGEITSSRPAENGAGAVAQGFLESSNVKLAEEMVNLVLAQRAYELNARVIQASDEMLAISNNLRR